MEKIYVDTNVFLNPILYDTAKVPDALHAQEVLRQVVKGDVEAFTATLTWDELVWVIRKEMGVDVSREKGKEFLAFPRLQLVDVTLKIINKAQDLLEKYSIKPRDAIHLAAAISCNVDKILTLDDDFKGIIELPFEKP